MRYRILGPLSVTEAGHAVAVTAGRDRTVLAMLLVNPNRIVGAGELIEAMWDGAPPATARGQLQSCISRLRRILQPGVILTDRAGYGIRVGPDELDAEVFARSVERARAGGDRAAFRAALGLWRGPACAELDAPAIRQAAAVLDERFGLAVEDWAELELAAGNERELAGELSAYVERFPLRERLRGQLMLALARSGRQADALAEFRKARRLLADELGIEPGEELQGRHREILNREISSGPAAETRAEGPVRCLPRTVGDFTGRREQIDRLLDEITVAADAGPVVAVIDGMAGSGKTTLALHVAGLIGERYPDAHLFIDLQGHSEQAPVEPAAALLVLLRQLGRTAGEIPADPVDRVALWRTELSRRRSLVILDNVASSAQVADLLPTAPGSLALVTSRRRLAGLDGVHLESMPLLAPDDAVALLARIAGDRVRTEPEAAAEVVRRCGRLPLAVRLAGSRLAHRPRWRVADLVRRLGQTALPELAAEDRSVADAFTLTFRLLPEPLRRAFRLLGVHPGKAFDALAVAALTGLPLDEAEDALDDLLDVHLVEEPERGVFRMHDLLREYAGMLAADLPPAERRDALTGLLDFQLHAGIAGTAAGYQERLRRDLGSPSPLRPDLLAALGDPTGRLEWDRPNLAALVDAAAGIGRTDYAWAIPRAAWYLLFFRGYTDDLRDLLLRAMAVLERAAEPDRAAIASVANYLASVHARTAEHAEAEKCLWRSIRLREELRDFSGLATAYSNLASVYQAVGRFTECIDAVLLFRLLSIRAGSTAGFATKLLTLAETLGTLGRYEEALRYARIRLLAVIDDRDDNLIATSLLLIQRLRTVQGTMTPATAHRYVDAADRLVRPSGYRSSEADVHGYRAVLFQAEGRYAEAVAEHRRAVEIARPLLDSRHETEFRYDWATTLRLSGDLPAAREMYRRVLDLARRGGQAYVVAQAEAGLAACLDPADPERDRLRAHAAELFERMGVPERTEFRAHVAA
ncbi:AfsR/SARP family transcriptional regulator [Actinoplanes siamensis]|uniref:AfsR/SARP family transcriptional regulator n=1 Tax=Actinoplanes siamensis TaxID=1223317 RepID=UPI001EF2AF86|nr:BTAD domain-containing putative transcriptional regulator [Actinoplanes siamensis]